MLVCQAISIEKGPDRSHAQVEGFSEYKNAMNGSQGLSPVTEARDDGWHM